MAHKKLSIIQRLIRQLKKLPELDYDKLDALLMRTKMIISNVFGDSSHYLRDLATICFRDPTPEPSQYPSHMMKFPPDYPDHKKYWSNGMRQMQNMFNTMLEDIRMSNDIPRLVGEDKRIVAGIANKDKIFISHSSKDKLIADHFIDDVLVGSLNIKNRDIICTSVEGYEIKSGEDWRHEIREGLCSSKIVFLVITSNYKSSEICLNEMGAAWAMCDKVIPVILKPINYKSVGVLNEVLKIEVLNDEASLDNIKDEVMSVLGIPAGDVSTAKWNKKKAEFIRKVNKYIHDNPFPFPSSEDDIKRLEADNKLLAIELESIKKESEEKNIELEAIKGLKDKSQVDEMIYKIGNGSGGREIFEKLVKSVVEGLRRFDPAVKKIIFSDYSGKEVSMDWLNDKDAIQNAKARNYLSFDLVGNCCIEWDKTDRMKALWGALKMLDEFMGKKVSSSFIPWFKKEYDDTPFILKDLTFWEKVLYI